MLAQSESTANSEETLNEIIVFGRGEQQIGRAKAASEGAVGGDDLLVRPMLRVADLRATLGLRGDYYNFDVSANPGAGDTVNVGKKTDSIFSPKNSGDHYAKNEEKKMRGKFLLFCFELQQLRQQS